MNESLRLHLDPDSAAEMAVNATMMYLGFSGIMDKEEKQEWISKVFKTIRARVDRAS